MAGRGFRAVAAAAAVGSSPVLAGGHVAGTGEPLPGRPPSPTCTAGPDPGAASAQLAGCEQRIQPAEPGSVPTVAIVGASFTAGIGPRHPAGSWAVLLARRLHWNAFVYGVPGAGYVHLGLGRKGPVAREIARVHLGTLQPSLIIVQAGHDDMSVPPDLERLRVEQTVAMIRAQAPNADRAGDGVRRAPAHARSLPHRPGDRGRGRGRGPGSDHHGPARVGMEVPPRA